MPNTVKRLNYYDHQFLRAPDFSDEQHYHMGMRRLHNSALHTWGIVQGLQVTPASGGTGTAVTVNAGAAMDSTGREMVLPTDTDLELGGETAGTTLYITITYDEQQSDPTTEAGGPGNTRITEAPKLSFAKDAPADKSMTLILAKVPRTNTGLGAVDGSDRKQAGVVLGSELTINTLTLKKDGIAQANWPVLSCGAANQAALANAGLVVNGSVGIGPAAPNRNLSISGAGAAGAYANIKNDNHEVLLGVDTAAILSAMTASDLQIRTNNATRVLVQANTGNVGIGTTNPSAKLHVSGSEGTANGFNAAITLENTAANGRKWYLRSGATGTSTPVGGMSIADDAAHRLVIKPDGSVGIGTMNPTEPLEVNGRSKSGALTVGPWPPNPAAYVFFGANTLNQGAAGNYALLQGTTAGDQGRTFLNSPVDIRFRINNADQMVLANNNLGVLMGSNPINFTGGWSGSPDPVTNVSEISNDIGTYKTLMIVGNKSAGLGRRVSVWDRFEVNGDAFKFGGGAWGTISDKKLKKNISPLQGALDRLLSLRGVSFEWKDPKSYGNMTGPQMGLVAQEVEAVFPEWVGQDQEGTKTLSIRGFEALVIEAFREIKQEINAVKVSLAEIQSKLGIEAKNKKSADKVPKSSARKTGHS
jgi:Chaperone of endosialidase